MQNNIHTLLDPLHLDDLNNPLHPSVYVEHESYNFLILRFPIADENDQISAFSQGIVITDEKIFLYEREKIFIPLESDWESLHKILDKYIDQSLDLVNSLREQILGIEETLLHKTFKKTFLHNWFRIRKELVAMNRILIRTNLIYEQFFQKNEKYFTPYIHSFHDLFEHLSRSQRYVDHDIEKLNTLYNFYSARNNDRMNESIYLLTLLSAFFLPPNFLVGYFGMNTGSMPFTQTGGTMTVTWLLVWISMILFMFFLFKRYKN